MIWKTKFFDLIEEDTRLAWDYATALRGCDIRSLNSIDIKLFYTAPLRGRECEGLSQWDTLERCKFLKTDKGLIDLINDLKRGVGRTSRHYIIHSAKGYDAIGQNKIRRAILNGCYNDNDNTKYVWEVIWRVNNYVRKSWKKGG